MTRFNKSVKLVSLTRTKQSNGAYATTKTETTAFANRFTRGYAYSLNSKAVGLQADCEIQMRSSSYNGQEEVKMDGIEYDVETVRETGEFVVLSLARKISND